MCRRAREDDQDRIDEAAGWVSPEALSFGVNELACRAVIALARERDESPADGGPEPSRPACGLTAQGAGSDRDGPRSQVDCSSRRRRVIR